MKTIEDVNNLKAQWRNDPCWDIENTEGFEEYKDELHIYRQLCEIEWAINVEKRIEFVALRLGCSKELAQYIISTEQLIASLENQVKDLTNRLAILEHKVNNG